MLAFWAPQKELAFWTLLGGLDGQNESGPFSILYFIVASLCPIGFHTFLFYRSLTLHLGPPLCSQSLDLSELWVDSDTPGVSHLLQCESPQRKHLLTYLGLLQRGDACHLPLALPTSPWGLLEQSPSPLLPPTLLGLRARPLIPEGPLIILG